MPEILAFFGVIGIAAGWIITIILSSLNLTTKNDMIQLIYGGDTFAPFLNATDLLFIILPLILVAFFAVLYPMYIARNITR